MLTLVRLSVVCLSVTLVRPTQAVQIFGNISTASGTWPSVEIHGKFYGDRQRRTPPPGELNTRGVAKYSDFGPIDGYISTRSPSIAEGPRDAGVPVEIW